MRLTNLIRIVLCLTLLVQMSSLFAADAESGKQKAAMCFGCHGQNGQSSSASFPILAGQTAPYLVKQLNDFKSGTRSNPMMQNMASGLSKQDIINLATFFSSVQTKSAGGNAKLALTGKDKFNQCAGCHGSKAEGRASFPRLAGQHPDYIIKQLQAFKSGTRENGTMKAMASGLSDQDMKAIAAYLGTL